MSTQHKTWLNFKEEATKGEINSLPSKTQPDEVMSITEMLHNHARGLPVNVKEGSYHDEELGYIPEINTLDLTEIEDLRDHYKQQAKTMEDAIKQKAAADKKAAKEAAAAEAEEKKAIADFLKSKKSGAADKPTPSGGQ